MKKNNLFKMLHNLGIFGLITFLILFEISDNNLFFSLCLISLAAAVIGNHLSSSDDNNDSFFDFTFGGDDYGSGDDFSHSDFGHSDFCHSDFDCGGSGDCDCGCDD